MRKKRAWSTLVCVLTLVLGILLPALGASGQPEVYLLAVNDKLADLPGGVRPLNIGGVIYVPYAAFDRNATGVDLGVYYGVDRARNSTLTLYNQEHMLVFHVYQAMCEDGQGNAMDFHATLRNGVPYVPAEAVCEYFHLRCSCLPTADRGTLIRISSDAASMTDAVFLDLARQQMLDRYNKLLASAAPQSTPVPTSPANTAAPPYSSPPPVSSPGPTPVGSGEKETIEVYLAVDATEGDREWLEQRNEVFPLILFPAGELTEYREQIRRAVSLGYPVGLLVRSTVLEEVQAELARGNELLGHIARTRTRIVSAPAGLTSTLTDAGWFCWQSDLTGGPIRSVWKELEKRRSTVRLTLSIAPSALRSTEDVLRRLAGNDRYLVRQPLEIGL